MTLTPQQQEDYDALVAWLTKAGVDFEEAQEDLDRWAKDLHFDARKEIEFQKKRDREKARKRREAEGLQQASPQPTS